MDDHRLFCGIMDQICEAAADAVRRYAEVSGVDPVRIFFPNEPRRPRGSMDEHFPLAIVFDRLGRTGRREGLRMRLWPTLESLGGSSGDNRKPDLAINHPSDESQMLGLVDFKK